MSKEKISIPVFVAVFSLPLANHYKNSLISNPALLDDYLNTPVTNIHLPEAVINVFRDSGFNNTGDILNNFKRFGSLKLEGLGRTPSERVINMISEDITRYFESEPVMSELGKTEKGTVRNKIISMTNGVLGLACQNEVNILLKIINMKREPGNLLNVPVESIDWSARNLNALKILHINRISDLSNISARRLLKMKGYGKKSLVEIVVKLGKYFNDYYGEINEDSSTVISPHDLEILVRHMLSKLSSQQERILSSRYGLWDGKRETLAELGRQFGLSRERIRQIQKDATNKLRRFNWIKIVDRSKTYSMKDDHLAISMRKLFNAGMLPFMKNNHNVANKSELLQIIYAIDNESAEVDLANEFLSIVFFDNKSIFRDFVVEFTGQIVGLHEKDRDVLLKTIRTAKDYLIEKAVPQSMDDLLSFFEKIDFFKKFKIGRSKLRRFLEISSIARDSTGKFGLRRWKYFDAYTIKCMVERAVVEIGEPAHFKEIARIMDEMFPEHSPFDPFRVHARMGANRDIFTWTSPGYYGLKIWGLKRIPYTKDYLIELLQLADRPVPKDELIKKVIKKCKSTASSVYVTLISSKSVFKKFPGGCFGLVEWE